MGSLLNFISFLSVERTAAAIWRWGIGKKCGSLVNRQRGSAGNIEFNQFEQSAIFTASCPAACVECSHLAGWSQLLKDPSNLDEPKSIFLLKSPHQRSYTFISIKCDLCVGIMTLCICPTYSLVEDPLLYKWWCTLPLSISPLPIKPSCPSCLPQSVFPLKPDLPA